MFLYVACAKYSYSTNQTCHHKFSLKFFDAFVPDMRQLICLLMKHDFVSMGVLTLQINGCLQKI